MLFADEAFFAGDKKHEGILKALITEPHLTIEAKGIDAEPARNFLHLIVTSNEDWVVPASADERRFVVCETGEERMQDTSHFRELQRQLDEGGRENLLHFLLQRPLDQFEVREVPWTAALDRQKVASLGPVAEYLALVLADGALPNNVRNHVDFVLTNGGANIYGMLDDARVRVPGMKRVSERLLYDGLKAIGCKRAQGPPKGWRFPPLAQARRNFERAFCPFEWDGEVVDWQPAVGRQTKAPF